MSCSTARPPAPLPCTTCPPTPRRRSRRLCSTGAASASGTRPRTAATRRRRCSSCSWRTRDRAVSAPKAARLTQDGSPEAQGSSAEAAARPQRGDELQLRIESLAYGGEGVARLGDGGYVVFVAGAVPGDLVRAVVHRRKRTYARARAVEVLEPSPERIPPRADHPGVAWQVLPYERQLEVKQAQIDEALRRIGRLEGFALDAPLAADEQWRYRNKLEYSFGMLAGAGRQELICGFHAPAGANHVV